MDKKHKYGVSCNVDSNKYYHVRCRARRQERANRGVCVRCGKNAAQENRAWCASCTKRETAVTMERRRKRQALGLCIKCGVVLNDTSQVHCKVHKDEASGGLRRRQRKRVEEGKCVRCGNNELVTTAVCFNHWLIRISGSATGNSSKKVAVKVWDIMLEQNMRCPYTGKELLPGKNASIDHIIPRSRGGSNELANLQWVDHTINIMKHNLLYEEFVETVKLLAERFNGG